MSLNSTTTLADAVTKDPRRAAILEEYKLDFCCGGAKSLEEAANEAGVDLDELLAALILPENEDAVVRTGNNAALAHDIVDTHHSYMWEEIPRLGALIEKVFRVHGERHPELRAIRNTYNEMVAELEPHMTREERAVFPVVSKLEKGESPRGAQNLSETIDELVEEHQAVGEMLRRLRHLTKDYQLPEDACTSYLLAYQGLEEMERDLHLHIHKENNVLFPAALELER